MADVYIAAVGGKQPDGRFRPGIIRPPFAEHDLAHYVIDAFAAGLARSGVAPYLEYDPELDDRGPAVAANDRQPRCADLVAFAAGRAGGVRVEVAEDTTAENRAAAEEACRLVADACSIACLGVASSDRAWLVNTAMPAWWVEVACLDDDADRAALQQARFLSHAGEALAEARCHYFDVEYRNPARGSVPAAGADRVECGDRTSWFAENHPTLGLGAGCGDEPSDPVAHLQTLLGVMVDGRFGYLTQWAVQSVQRRFGLDGDGICGPGTWAVLHSVERQGSVGYGTKEIQRALGILDDGVLGPVTAAHVEAFQRTAGTIPDGRFTEDHYRLLLNR